MPNTPTQPRPAAPAPLVPLERETLQSKILVQLEERLITGQFRPGERLTLRALAAQLGTSLMPVRDAIQHLQSIGVLVPQANRTLTVPLLTRDALQELSEVRLVLEGMAAERAAAVADAPGLERLKARFEALRHSREDLGGAGYLRAHWDFHLEIAHLSRTPTLVTLLTAVWLRIGPTIQVSERALHGRMEAVTVHKAILDAILAGDGAAARQAVEADIFHAIPRQDLKALRGDP